MELVLLLVGTMVIVASSVHVARARQLEVVAISPAGKRSSLVARTMPAHYPVVEKSDAAWYRRQDTNRRSIWLKQW